jgi:putative endonuclease
LTTIQIGQNAEQKALTYLIDQGLKLVAQNYSCKIGEIDLIMHDGAYLVFVEVRARSNLNYGSGLVSVTHSKRQKIIKTASYYLMKYKLYDRVPIRFDVISIDGKSGVITWVNDAFTLDY